jgi:hypothetical protein
VFATKSAISSAQRAALREHQECKLAFATESAIESILSEAEGLIGLGAEVKFTKCHYKYIGPGDPSLLCCQ